MLQHEAQVATRIRVSLLLAVAASAWVVTGVRMDGMDMGPGAELGGLGWFAVTWVAMMEAMMLPALGPTVVRQRGSSALFVVGYLIPWAAAGALAYAVVEAARALDPSFLTWDDGGRYVAAAVILGAALYQLTPAKDVALRRCRGAGARPTGIEYGVLCVTCCWAMMAVLFALGVMSLVWMAVVAALITAERLLPWRRAAKRGVAVVLVVVGLAVAVAPASVPGLTMPSGMDHSISSMEAR